MHDQGVRTFVCFSLPLFLPSPIPLPPSLSFSRRPRSSALPGSKEREKEEGEREARCTHTGVEGAVQGYRYGQVEPLVLLNLITSGPGGDRYFRVSFPGNRPRDSAVRHILYAFRLVDPIYNPVHPSVRPSVRPFVRSFVRSSIRPIRP